MSTILSVKNLSVRLDGATILHDVSFDLEKGQSLAIIGPNGSGKTVLLKTLLGILPHEGKIEWTANAKIGYVPQKIDADRHLPINLANLLAAKAAVLKLPKSDVQSAAETVGMAARIMHTPIGHLSGGQFQKALIAFALLGNPNTILFDEPTASLDQLAEEHIYDLMHTLQEKRGVSIIHVSHDLSVVYRYADRVLCLNKEKICYGSPEDALSPEILNKLYGGLQKYHHHPTHAQ